jgi:tRNA(Ile)-lysidine synthase
VPANPPLVEKVERWLRRREMAPGGVVVAISGGPDSVALLRALLHLRGSTGTPVVLAHFNHQMRGVESETDEAFVAALHAELTAKGFDNLEIRHTRLDVPALVRTEGGNIEAVARRVRYDWLAEVARQSGVTSVATGHTADDQAETVLHRLLRGTGLKGLAGIPDRRELAPGIEVVRPMLRVRRSEVLEYLHAVGQPYRTDSSNADLQYTRNRIRHELLPHLAERYNPEIVSLLGRLAQQAGEIYQSEEAEANDLLAQAERPRAGATLVFDRQSLASAPRRLVREVFRLVWKREGWPVGPMGFEDWDQLADVACKESNGVDMPDGVRAQCRERVVQLLRHHEPMA